MTSYLDLQAYYANLLILQYRGLPKASATIKALVALSLVDRLPLQIQDAFNIDTAIGVQLDVLGKYVGISRNAADFTGPVSLSDTDFRQLIRIKIAQNNSGSSLSDIQNFLHLFFNGVLQVFDYADMRLSYLMDSSIGSEELAEVFVRSGLLPKPMGVSLAVVVFAPAINNLFGFGTTQAPPFNVHGFNTTLQYDTNCPWLNHTDFLTG